MKILIGGAWPYANGSLHIGHIAGLLPGDVLARYHRAIGNQVYYVSGSDCHGTPVSIRAAQEGSSPEEVSGRYHQEFCRCFDALGFSYDKYGKTSAPEHTRFASDFHAKLYQSPLVYEQTEQQAYCPSCRRFLADRFLTGTCPACGAPARGDQCDACGTVLDSASLSEPVCALCGGKPEWQESRHLYLAASRLEPQLRALLENSRGWRKNAQAFTRRYLDEGLRDRALTRDLDWGIDVPKPGYEGKKIYIWAENVLGYLSMSAALLEEQGEDFRSLWGEEADALHYYVHAKDNIPFHTIILPALLLAQGENLRLPDRIVSNEYLTLEGRKVSTSQNWAIWVKDLIGRYHPDSIRYFMLANGPEKRDADFTWAEFVRCHNSDLVGVYGNFVHRTLAFVEKYRGSLVPDSAWEPWLEEELAALYTQVGSAIAEGKLREALGLILEQAKAANRFFDTCRPWALREGDPAGCSRCLFLCVQLIANLANLFAPFLPFSSAQVLSRFGLSPSWALCKVPGGLRLPPAALLFERLDRDTAERERERLGV